MGLADKINQLTKDHYTGELIIIRNGHLGMYQTKAQYLKNADAFCNELSEKTIARLSDADELWEIQWYKDTPVSFIKVYANSLEEGIDMITAVLS